MPLVKRNTLVEPPGARNAMLVVMPPVIASALMPVNPAPLPENIAALTEPLKPGLLLSKATFVGSRAPGTFP